MRIKTKIDWKWVKVQLYKKEGLLTDASGSKSFIIKSAGICIKEARKLAKPRIIIKELSPKNIDLLKITGKVSLYLKKSEKIYLFAVTIGDGIEKLSSLLMKKDDALSGYMLDVIGSFAVESLAESVEEGLRKIYAKKGMSVSMRLSPGYCDWPIEKQLSIKDILNFKKAGITLTESCMMIPRKSISAIVGIGKRGVFGKDTSQCRICSEKNCDYRRMD